MLAGDPARLGEAVSYIEASILPDIEAQEGVRAVACMVNADLGICLAASYWDGLDTMIASEQLVQVPRKEVIECLRGTATVEHYEVPVFVRRRRPRDEAAGVRINRFDCAPADIDTAIKEFRNTDVPALLDTPALCSAHIMTDRTTGRCIVSTGWETMAAMRDSRSVAARLRANVVDVAHMQVRSVEEYRMAFSSVHDGIALEVGVWVSALTHGDTLARQRKLPDRIHYWVI